MQEINLRHFLALSVMVDAGSLSAAAKRVHLSQSALTQALRKIETLAGTSLFNRTGFGITPTTAGKRLVHRSKRALKLLNRAKREIRQNESVGLNPNQPSWHVTAGQLRALIAIVQTGGYSLAARKLGLAQPTIYRAAKDLEARTGLRLFQRSDKSVVANKAAQQMARYAALIFAEIRQGLEEVHEEQGHMQSRVSVGCLPLARVELLPLAVTQLLQTYPDASVSILDGPYSEQLQALRYGQIDWIIGALRKPPPTSDIQQQHLFDEPLVIVVRTGHPMLTRATPKPVALAQLEWIVPAKHTPARALFHDFFSKHDVATPRKVIECSSLITTRGLLHDSDRAALLSPSQVRRDIATMQLAILGKPLPNTCRSIGVTVRKDWEPTIVQKAFTEIIQAQT